MTNKDNVPEKLLINFEDIDAVVALLKVMGKRGDTKLIEYIRKDIADKQAGERYYEGYNEGYGKGYEYNDK